MGTPGSPSTSAAPYPPPGAGAGVCVVAHDFATMPLPRRLPIGIAAWVTTDRYAVLCQVSRFGQTAPDAEPAAARATPSAATMAVARRMYRTPALGRHKRADPR